MNTILYNIHRYSVAVLLLLAFGAFQSCNDDDEFTEPEITTGYLQVKLTKEASSKSSELDYLNDAKKIRVALFDENNNSIQQTVALSSKNDSTAEYILSSEKLELLAGTYRLTGYYLYDGLENEIYFAQLDEAQVLDVPAGGLEVTSLEVTATQYGRVHFNFNKVISSSRSNATKSSTESFVLRYVAEVDLTIRNIDTNELFDIDSIPVSYTEFFDGDSAGSPLSSGIEADTSYVLKAGNYEVTEYALLNAARTATFSTNDNVDENSFEVVNLETAESDIPLILEESAANIQDYLTLYEIWEALDGENWNFQGFAYPTGTNWDFNKDLDMWGEQPGVYLDSEGRITGLEIGGFNPQGYVPDAIGRLAKLELLYLGELNDETGNIDYPDARSLSTSTGPTSLRDLNQLYFDKYVYVDPMHTFSECVQEGIAEAKDIPYVKADLESPQFTPIYGTYTNGITGISPEIGKLSALTLFSIANSPITELPAELADLNNLTDLQIANCPDLTSLPSFLATGFPQLVSINLAMNYQIPAADLESWLDELATYEGTKDEPTIQLMYLSYNSLEGLPASFSNMRALGALDCSYNQITDVPAFGDEVSPVQLYFSHNNISQINTTSDGVFCNMADMESIEFDNNNLTEFPDIFSAGDDAALVGTVNLSYNQISKVECERGIFAETLSLAVNKLTEYPAAIFDNGSYVSFLSLGNNLIESFPEGSFEKEGGDDRIYGLNSIDLTYNRLVSDSITDEINGRNLPFLQTVDISFNRLTDFPTNFLNVQGLSTLAIRYQHDEDGYRCFSDWTPGLSLHGSLRRLYVGGNNFGEITYSSTEGISQVYEILDISDNPDISIDLSSVCYRIGIGRLAVVYDKTQDITGCDYISLD